MGSELQQLIDWMEEEKTSINKRMENMDIDLRLLHGQQISLLNKAIDKVIQVYKPEKVGEYLVTKDGEEFTSYWDGYFWGYEGEVITGIESWKAKELQATEQVPTRMQRCPICEGQGYTAKPSYVPAGVDNWSSTSVSHVCHYCNGAKVIPAGYEADKWIRVEDELPTEEDADENGKLLVWREMNPDQKAIEKSIMDWSMLRYCDKETTHWQPLPSPPKTK